MFGVIAVQWCPYCQKVWLQVRGVAIRLLLSLPFSHCRWQFGLRCTCLTEALQQMLLGAPAATSSSVVHLVFGCCFTALNGMTNGSSIHYLAGCMVQNLAVLLVLTRCPAACLCVFVVQLEEKRIPYTMEKINMRCYGDKPASFMAKVGNKHCTPLAPDSAASSSKTPPQCRNGITKLCSS